MVLEICSEFFKKGISPHLQEIEGCGLALCPQTLVLLEF